MSNEQDTGVCVNADKPAIRLFHRSLKRDHGEFASCCPFCPDGILLMQRDRTTLALLTEDVCSICAQHVVYADVEEGRVIITYKQTLGVRHEVD